MYADILLIISDVTDPEVAEHIEVTRAVIEELGASDKPVIYVYNKCDMLDGGVPAPEGDNTVAISGVTGQGIDRLLEVIEEEIHRFKKKYSLLIPYSNQSAVSALYNSYTVLEVNYVDEGIAVDVILDERGRGVYGKYITSV